MLYSLREEQNKNQLMKLGIIKKIFFLHLSYHLNTHTSTYTRHLSYSGKEIKIIRILFLLR